MQTQTGYSELKDFVQFANNLLASGIHDASVEELVQQWRSNKERTETLEDIRQGVADDCEGKVESVDGVFAEIRKALRTAKIKTLLQCDQAIFKTTCGLPS